MKKAAYLLVLAFSFLSVAAWAQDAATIVGTVTDASGAVVPNVNVEVSNPDKGFKRILASDSAGNYVAAKVPIGSYVITAEGAGFQKLMRSGITLQVGQVLRVDLQMQVGATTQQVTIVGNVPRVETETGTVSHVINGTQMVDLDLNGRGFTNLELLVVGASEANNAVNFTVPTSPNIAFNGMRSTGDRSEIDGAGDTDMGAGGASNDVIPSIDSIAEFRIITNNYGADMGQAGGSIIELVTKSGTREWHGGVYEFVRNTAFNSNDFFANRVIAPAGGNAPEVPYHWNDPGYYIGGPFYIPGVYNTDKSKTFFFWSQEFHRYRTGSVINTTVPTLLQRQGNFSQCDSTSPNYSSVIAAGCVLPKIPGSGGQVYPNDIVPVNPDATDMLNGLVPLPDSGLNGYIAAPSNPVDWGQQQIRVDQNISDRTSLFFRFTHDAYDEVLYPGCCTTPSEGGGTYDTVGAIEYRLSFNTTLHLTHSFSSRMMNEFIVGYTSDGLFFQHPVVGPSNVAGSFDQPANWSMAHLFAANASNPELPTVTVSGGGQGFGVTGVPVNPAQSDVAPTYQLKDNLVDVVGKHTLKTGFLVNQYRVYQPLGISTQGVLTFSAGSSPNSTGNGLADMDIGAIAQYEEGSQTVNGVAVGGYPKYHWRNLDFEPYFQDDWKISHKLTLNLGIRYYWLDTVHDFDFPGKDVNFVPSLFNPALEAKLNASGYIVAGSGDTWNQFGNGLVLCGANGVPLGCVNPKRGTVAPRFGFAFDPTGSGKTVIRGGYGIFYDIGPQGGDAAYALIENPPVEFAPSAYNVLGYSNITQGNLGPAAINSLPEQTKYTAVQQFNLTVQHEFRAHNLLSVAYVGTLAHHLPQVVALEQIPIGVTTELVPALAGTAGCDSSGNCNVQSILQAKQHSVSFFVPYQDFSTITSHTNIANSNYNGLQVELTHPFGHGLMVQAAYSWSHWLDDATTQTEGCIDTTDLERCYANSDLNRPQSLVLNYVYALPFFAQSPNKFLRQFGGWRVSGITSFFSGLPFTPSCGFGSYATGIGGGVDCNSLAPLKVAKGTVNYAPYGPTPSWFTPGIYGQPLQAQLAANEEPGMFGYMGRNVLPGPGRNNFDLALLKDFGMPWFGGERSRLEFRLETFNTFNHPQWAGVSAGCATTTTFGNPCSGSANPSVGVVSSDWPARVMQLGLKLTF